MEIEMEKRNTMRFEIEKTVVKTVMVKETLDIGLCKYEDEVTLTVNGWHIFGINKRGNCRLVPFAKGCGLKTDKEGRVILRN